jgi:hypothetical protein
MAAILISLFTYDVGVTRLHEQLLARMRILIEL